MRVGIASDHGGFRLKSELVAALRQRPGLTVEDLGTDSEASTDYPDHAQELARRILAGTYDRGILVCGTGVGMAITANRYPGIRCVNCSDTYTARLSRQHNDTNVLALGERVLGKGLAWDIVVAWLEEEAELDERHVRRRAKMDAIAAASSPRT